MGKYLIVCSLVLFLIALCNAEASDQFKPGRCPPEPTDENSNPDNIRPDQDDSNKEPNFQCDFDFDCGKDNIKKCCPLSDGRGTACMYPERDTRGEVKMNQ